MISDYCSDYMDGVRAGKYLLKIEPDEGTENPRDFDCNVSRMVFWHGRNNLGDKHNYENPNSFLETLNEEEKNFVILKVFMYEHSGRALRATEFNGSNPFNDPWDSGFLGFIYATTETVKESYCFDLANLKPGEIEKIKEGLKIELETYNQWIEGDCWWFKLSAVPDEIWQDRLTELKEEYPEYTQQELEEDLILGLEDADYSEEVDSCGGFYGGDLTENGILENFDNDVRKAFDFPLIEEREAA